MRTQRSAHALTLYMIIDTDAFITCTKFVTMRRFNFAFLSFLTGASVFLTGSPPKASRKDYACSGFSSLLLFSFIGTC